MKLSVPSNAKIAKDAKEAVQESVSEFISFITSEAAEKCLIEKRKTIGGEDIVYTMKSLGFDNYAAVLQVHLAKLRQVGPELYHTVQCLMNGVAPGNGIGGKITGSSFGRRR